VQRERVTAKRVGHTGTHASEEISGTKKGSGCAPLPIRTSRLQMRARPRGATAPPRAHDVRRHWHSPQRPAMAPQSAWRAPFQPEAGILRGARLTSGMTLEASFPRRGVGDVPTHCPTELLILWAYKAPILLNKRPHHHIAAMQAPQRGAVAGQSLWLFTRNSRLVIMRPHVSLASCGHIRRGGRARRQAKGAPL